MGIIFDSWQRGMVSHPRISILIPSRLKIPFQSLISHLISPIRNPIVPSSVILGFARCLAHRITLDERVVEILVIPVHHSLERSLVRSFEVVRRTLIIEFIVGRGIVRIRFIGRVGLASDRVVEIRSSSLVRYPCLASRESGFRGSRQASIPARGIREAVHAADRGGLRRSQIKIEICPDGEGILAFAGGCWSCERWAPSASNASFVRIGIGG